MEEAFASEGIKVIYDFLPWARGFNSAQAGDLDGIILYTHNAEREKDFYYSELPIASGTLVFFHLKSVPFKWESYDDLKGLKVAGLIGSSYGKEFEEAEKAQKFKVDWGSSEEINLRKLLAQRIQLQIIEQEVGYDLLQTKFQPAEIQLVTHYPKPVRISMFHLILSKKVAQNEARLKRFNSGLKKLKESGKYDQYYEESMKGAYLKK